MKTDTYSSKLVDFSLDLKYNNIPEEALKNAKFHILDLIGVTIASTRENSSKIAYNTFNKLGGNSESTVIGSKKKLNVPAAALTNSMMSHTDDFDDTHGVAVVHPSSTVVPTNLAVGELCLSTGKEFLTSAIAAYEVLLRIGMVAPGKFHDVGFHPTGLCGIFGSAISTSKLRGVNREIAQNALGICGSLSAGILEFLNDGSNVKRLHPGWACYSGILAVMFAEEGITGPREVFEGRYGFLKTHLCNEEYNIEKLVEGLGSIWEINNVSYKAYPVCHHISSFLDCIRAIRARENFNLEDIEEVECIISPRQAKVVCEPTEEKLLPPTPYAGKFSLYYSVATEIINRKCDLTHFTDEAIKNQEVLDFAKKIRVTLSDSTGYPGAFPGWVKIYLKNGKSFEHRERNNRGGPENPLTEAEIITKFQNNALIVLPKKKVTEIQNKILNIEDLNSINSLTEDLRF